MSQQTKLSINAAAQCVQLQVGETIVGLASPHYRLSSPDGQWELKLPRSAFQGMPANPGEALIVTIGLTRVAVELVEDPKVLLANQGLFDS